MRVFYAITFGLLLRVPTNGETPGVVFWPEDQAGEIGPALSLYWGVEYPTPFPVTCETAEAFVTRASQLIHLERNDPTTNRRVSLERIGLKDDPADFYTLGYVS